MIVNYHLGVSENFKVWLLYEIERRGWSYETLARKIGVTHSSVSQWVNGKYPPKPGQLRKLSEVLEVDEIYLFQMVGYLSYAEGGQEEGVTPAHPLIREIMRELPGLDEDGLRLLRDSIRLLLLPRFGRKGEEDGKAIRRENKE